MPITPGKRRLEQARLSWEGLTQETGVTTDDIDRRIVDYGFQSYFPAITPPSSGTLCRRPARPTQGRHRRNMPPPGLHRPGAPNPAGKAAPTTPPWPQLTGDRLENMDTFACTWRAYPKRKAR